MHKRAGRKTSFPIDKERMSWAVLPPRGFTLIEMLVVVAIISLLMSLIVPSLRNARENAVKTACRGNLRQAGVALLGYEVDTRYLPKDGGEYWHHTPNSSRSLRLLVWGGYLPVSDRYVQTGSPDGSEVLHCPGDPNVTDRTYSLSYHYRYAVRTARPDDPLRVPVQTWNWPGEYRRGYSKYLMFCSIRARPGEYAETVFHPFPVGDARAGSYPYPDDVSPDSHWHRDGANAVYHDGHTSWVPFGTALGDH